MFLLELSFAMQHNSLVLKFLVPVCLNKFEKLPHTKRLALFCCLERRMCVYVECVCMCVCVCVCVCAVSYTHLRAHET